MATQVTAPVNVVAGELTSVIPPGYSDIGNPVQAIEVYNNTSFVLTVRSESGPRFLQPLTADLFPCSSIGAAPDVQPVTFLPNTTYLGTVTSTIYYQGDQLPAVPTFSLPPFPGGSQQVVSNFTFLSGLGGLHSYPAVAVAPPGGTYVLEFPTPTLQGRTDLAIALPMELTVTGVQSGTVYASAISVTASTLTVWVNPSADTQYDIVWTNPSMAGIGGPFVWSLYAAPGIIPTFATLSEDVNLTTGGEPVLAAPTSGAWYLFDIDLYNLSSLGYAVLNGGAVWGGSVGGSWPLGQLRVTTAITGGTSAGTATITLRYAPGP